MGKEGAAFAKEFTWSRAVEAFEQQARDTYQQRLSPQG